MSKVWARIEITSGIGAEATRRASAGGVHLDFTDVGERQFFIDGVEHDGGRICLHSCRGYDEAITVAHEVAAQSMVPVFDNTVPADDGLPDVTHLVGKGHEQRAREVSAAQRVVRATVDYLSAAVVRTPAPTPIGEVASEVVTRAQALAAAREFITICEAAGG